MSVHGRWDREPIHVVEKVNDGAASWGECTCGWQGNLSTDDARTDAECEAHERMVFQNRKAGRRMVRGRIE